MVIDFSRYLCILVIGMQTTAKKFDLTINTKWCKGCEICVAFCPKKVLAMERDKAMIINADACTGCQLCEIYCPDFAIVVNRNEPPKPAT